MGNVVVTNEKWGEYHFFSIFSITCRTLTYGILNEVGLVLCLIIKIFLPLLSMN